MKHIQSEISTGPKRNGGHRDNNNVKVVGMAATRVQDIATGSRERDLMESLNE